MSYLRKISPISRFIVNDRSMLPLYKPDDHVLTFNWAKIRVRDVIIFRFDGKNYIKRVKKISGNLIHIEGDNKKESSKFKTISLNSVVGRVILKY